MPRPKPEAGGRALILTGDRDLYQCVGPRVQVLYVSPATRGPAMSTRQRSSGATAYRRRSSPTSSPCAATRRTGLPGAKGIGAKTAADLLQRHGSLEARSTARFANARRGCAASLRDDADQLKEFKEIATLRQVKVSRPRSRKTDYAARRPGRAEFGMKRLAARLEEGVGARVVRVPVQPALRRTRPAGSAPAAPPSSSPCRRARARGLRVPAPLSRTFRLFGPVPVAGAEPVAFDVHLARGNRGLAQVRSAPAQQTRRSSGQPGDDARVQPHLVVDDHRDHARAQPRELQPQCEPGRRPT